MRSIFWGLYYLLAGAALVLAGMQMWETVTLADSAPQQAAGAGLTCAYLIFARICQAAAHSVKVDEHQEAQTNRLTKLLKLQQEQQPVQERA